MSPSLSYRMLELARSARKAGAHRLSRSRQRLIRNYSQDMPLQGIESDSRSFSKLGTPGAPRLATTGERSARKSSILWRE
jgi:hypothetical protein